MAANLSSAMDIDPPASLKRSNSAPMINELNSNMAAATGTASCSTSAAAVRLVAPQYPCGSRQAITSH